MQSSDHRQHGMFEFDDADDDILSTFDIDGADINGDDLLEALSNHDDNLFDDIDVDNDSYINAAPPQVTHTHPNPQSCDAPSIINTENIINTVNSSHGFIGAATAVDTFRRRATLDGEESRPNINIKNIRGSNKRRGREKKKKTPRRRNDSIASDEPLFGGGMMRQRSSSELDDDYMSESDVASACSAPADLLALCGLYDDPTNTPDVLDIHGMFLNPMSKQQNLQPSTNNMKGKEMREVEMMYSGGGGPDEETMLIRRRQQELLQEERKLQEAAAAQRPRRRKSHDGTLTLMDELRMNMTQDQDTGSAMKPIYGDTPVNILSGTAPIKRRKSEPMMDYFLEEMNGGDGNDNGFGNSAGRNLNQSAHSLDHLMGFPTDRFSTAASTPPNTSFMDNRGKSALDVAVEEAQDKINHLRQLLLVSRGLQNGGTNGGFSGQVQQQQQQQQPAKKNWWSSLQSELGGTGLNLHQGFGPDQDLTIPSRRVPKKKPKNKMKKKPEPQAPAQIPLPDKPDPEILKLDPTKLMKKLKDSMSRTTSSMKKLQEWDRANGLPKSHSQTMVNSNKSRKDLAKEAGLTLDEIQKEDMDAQKECLDEDMDESGQKNLSD